MNDFPDVDRSSERPSDRIGLEAFDRVQVPEQWDAIVARSSDIEITTGDSRRTGQWAMAAAVVALVAGGAIALVLRNADDPTVQTPSNVVDEPLSTSVTVPGTVDPIATVPDASDGAAGPETTVPVTTTPVTTLPAVITASTPAWSVACTEISGGRVGTSIDGSLLEFTGLGDVPALDLQLPVVRTVVGDLSPLVNVAAIPGGVIALIAPSGDWSVQTSMVDTAQLVAVNHDGSIRWRRCLDAVTASRTLAVAPFDASPTIAWVAVNRYEDDALDLLGFDLRTGGDVESAVGGAGQSVRTSAGRYLVIGAGYSQVQLAESDRLTVVDLVDGSTEERQYPPSARTGALEELFLDARIGASGNLILLDGIAAFEGVTAVDTGDGWTDDLAAVRAAVPPRLVDTYGEPYELRLVDGAGDVQWTITDFHSIPREGFQSLIAGDVAMVDRCTSFAADECQWAGDTPPSEELVAFDLETGAELWRREGSHAVPIAANGLGIMTERLSADGQPEEYGYVLIDLRTGERVGGGAEWTGAAFANECCGAGDYVYTRLDGGVVFAVNEATVKVWFPPEVTTTTKSVAVAD